MRPSSGRVVAFLFINLIIIIMLRIAVGTSASSNRGVTGRRSLTGGGGRFVTRRQKYDQVRSGLGLSSG